MFKVVLYRPAKLAQTNGLVGQQLAGYQLTKALSRKGTADVYLAEQLALQRTVAVKVLQTQLSSDDYKTFLDEAIALSQLKHPYIIAILDFFVHNSAPVLVMEYASRGNLRDLHRSREPLSLATVLPYVKQVAEALQDAHDRGRLHRNVRPENILVGARGELKLSSFAMELDARASLDTTGTSAYVAPEQLHGKTSAASDQYALGIMVYEWLTGDRPFKGSSSEVALQQIGAPPPAMQGVPLAVEAIVMKALAKEPSDRFENVAAFAAAFAAALEDAYNVYPRTSPLTPNLQATSGRPFTPITPFPSSGSLPGMSGNPAFEKTDPVLPVANLPYPPIRALVGKDRFRWPLSDLLLVEFDFLRLRHYRLFRNTGIALDILSGLLLALRMSSWLGLEGSLIASLLFLGCIVFVKKSVAFVAAVLLSIYWGVIGSIALWLISTIMHLSLYSPLELIIGGVVVGLISSVLHIRYVQNKLY